MRGWYEVYEVSVSTEQVPCSAYFIAICYDAFPSARYNSYDF